MISIVDITAITQTGQCVVQNTTRNETHSVNGFPITNIDLILSSDVKQ